MRTVNRRLLGRLWLWPAKKHGLDIPRVNTLGILCTRRVHPHVIRVFLEENGI